MPEPGSGVCNCGFHKAVGQPPNVLVQPVVATYAGFLLFGEALGPLQAAGAAVALAGVVIAQWASRPGPVRAAAESPA